MDTRREAAPGEAPLQPGGGSGPESGWAVKAVDCGSHSGRSAKLSRKGETLLQALLALQLCLEAHLTSRTFFPFLSKPQGLSLAQTAPQVPQNAVPGAV